MSSSHSGIVFIGNLPAKRTSQEQGQDFPFVVVMLDRVTDGEEMSVANVDIVCGVFTAEDDPEAGMHDCLNMIDRCRRILQEQNTLDDRFVLQKPINSTISRQDEKLTPRAYYVGWLGVSYVLPMVEQVYNINREGGYYGEEE